jgi:hypothetical protein
MGHIEKIDEIIARENLELQDLITAEERRLGKQSGLTRERLPEAMRGRRELWSVELEKIIRRLADAMEPEKIPAWLSTRTEALNDRTPLELIAHGEAERIDGAVTQIESQGNEE